jgi:DNA-binding NarL/FixJ family response regulator
MTAAQRPDVVVLDVSMPELNGLQAAALIHEEFPSIDIIILTMHEPAELMDHVALPGVRVCLQKTDLQLLVDAIREVSQPPLRNVAVR